MKQFMMEVDYRLIVDCDCEDAEDVANNFIAQLTELAATNEHILGLQVNSYPLPAVRQKAEDPVS